MEEKLEYISKSLTEIKVDIAEIRKDVNYHIKRTDLLEANVDSLAEAIKPIQHHVALVGGLGNAAAWILGVLAAAATVYAALK
jgi:hypothetical protein